MPASSANSRSSCCDARRTAPAAAARRGTRTRSTEPSDGVALVRAARAGGQRPRRASAAASVARVDGAKRRITARRGCGSSRYDQVSSSDAPATPQREHAGLRPPPGQRQRRRAPGASSQRRQPPQAAARDPAAARQAARVQRRRRAPAPRRVTQVERHARRQVQLRIGRRQPQAGQRSRRAMNSRLPAWHSAITAIEQVARLRPRQQQHDRRPGTAAGPTAPAARTARPAPPKPRGAALRRDRAGRRRTAACTGPWPACAAQALLLRRPGARARRRRPASAASAAAAGVDRAAGCPRPRRCAAARGRAAAAARVGVAGTSSTAPSASPRQVRVERAARRPACAPARTGRRSPAAPASTSAQAPAHPARVVSRRWPAPLERAGVEAVARRAGGRAPGVAAGVERAGSGRRAAQSARLLRRRSQPRRRLTPGPACWPARPLRRGWRR